MIKLVRFLFPLLPTMMASRLLILIAGRPFAYHLKSDEVVGLARAEKFSYSKGKYAWSWGSGPCVVLVHGWGGCAAQWHKLAETISKLGFRVLALDVTAHGQSEGSVVTFRNYATDLKLLHNYLQTDIYAYIGHSAGGLGMMAARYLEGLTAKKFVCIATPSYPYPPIKVIKKKISVSDDVIALYKKYLARQFSCAWEEITEKCFSYQNGSELLLIYDSEDRYLDAGDAQAILRHWPSALQIRADGIGHEKLIKSEDSIKQIGIFLKTQVPSSS